MPTFESSATSNRNSPVATTSLDSLLQSIRDPDLLLFPPAGTLQCGEIRVVDKDDDDDDRAVGSILFWITVKDTTPRLEFSCKHASQNVLRRTEKTKQKDIDVKETFEEHLCDPHMFDTGYSLAGATGFQIWAGTRIVLEAVAAATEPSSRRLSLISSTLTTNDNDTPPTPRPPRILELGAGIGVIGITLASVYGAHVLLTDLPTLVNHATYPNLQRNSNTASEGEMARQNTIPPVWLTEACANMRNNSGEEDEEEPFLVLPLGSRGGWATATSLDWRIPVREQLLLSTDSILSDLDYIIASDCVWLVSMLESLLDTVAEIWESRGSSSTLWLSFQRRDTTDDQSPTFTTVPRVLQAVLARGWTMECLAWMPVEDAVAAATKDTDDNDDNDDDIKEVFLFAIRPGQK